ncbi:MAG: hypothetical protein Tsb009_39350 [Planctomycetaceae bacterium]
MKIKSVYLGIDVSKRELHLAAPEKFLRAFDNTAAGRRNLVEYVQAIHPVGVVLEASGGYEQRIVELLKTDRVFQAKANVMTNVVGVAEKTAATLIAHFPELGTLRRGEVAALAGAAPHANESGTYRGKRD